MATTNDNLRKTVNDILAGLPHAKTASDPKTTHPSGKAPDGNSDTTMGAPGRETESTLKKDEPLGVPNASPNPAEPVDDDTQLGIQAKPIGKDPSVENDFKGVKDDPGTSTPVSTENSSIGGKYAAQLANLTKLASTVLVAIEGELKTAAATASSQATTPAATQAAPVAKTAAEEAGEDLASALLGSHLDSQKRAEVESDMLSKTADCLRFGEHLASEYSNYLYGLADGAQKAANAQAEAEAAAAAGGGGGMPPQAGAAPAGPQGAPPAGDGDGDEVPPEILQLLQGGGNMPGVSIEQLLGGGGAGGGGGGGENPQIAALLEAALAQEGGGEAPPEGMPPEEAKVAGLRKAAAILSKQSAAYRRLYPVVRATLRELART